MSVKVGEVYINKTSNVKYTVHSILDIDTCEVFINNGTVPFLAYINSILSVCSLQPQSYSYKEVGTKPLDQAIQKLDKVYCAHKNQSHEKYFNAKIFITCKDCGKPLN